MVASKCCCTLAKRAARFLTEIYDPALEPPTLKTMQCAQLRHTDRRELPTLTDLSQATGLDRSTLGRSPRVLEKSGVISLSTGVDKHARVASLISVEPLW